MTERLDEVLVLVGTPRNHSSTTWWQQKGSLDEVRDARLSKARESTVAQIGEEIVEVVVRRRIRLTGEVQATEVPLSASSEGVSE